MSKPVSALTNSPAGIASQLRLAANFLTIVPVGPGPADNAIVAASFRWFPLVGFLLGALFAAEDSLLLMVFPAMLRSTIVILSMVVVTGAVHLDALADTADALGAGRNRERALDILHDSRVGSFGAAAVCLSLALKIFALGSLHEPYRILALFVAPGLSRWAMVAVAAGLPYLRPEGGAGAALLQRENLVVPETADGAARGLLCRRRGLARGPAASLAARHLDVAGRLDLVRAVQRGLRGSRRRERLAAKGRRKREP